MRTLLRIFAPAALILLGLAAGCSHYRLGTSGELAFRTLYIAPVQNDSRLPQSTAIVTTQIREAFLRDGRVALAASPDEADATLDIVLADFTREVLTTRPDDTGLARKFGLTLHALCTLRDRRTGETLFASRRVQASRQVFATATPTQPESDQLQAEYQNVPLLAASLADGIAHATLDTW